ncbi:PilN domain-containing protein [Candidatus Shapirobacteria bacterium]|nr:PilN domain-containing protein [Candidatus Shapirobacteria bacterium]
MPTKKEVSLLPSENDINGFWPRFLNWITTVGRVVIVFAELIVICAFISRFWLDRKNSDLSEILRQQKAILASTQEFEDDYTNLQQRLKFIKEFYQSEPKYVENLNSLTSSLPDSIYFQNLSLKKDDTVKKVSSQISLYAYEENPIVDFIVNLKLNPDIETVDVKRIEKKPKDGKYYLDIFVVFKK